MTAYVRPGIDLMFESENGMLGIGPPPAECDEEVDLINAGKQAVTALAGASFFAMSRLR